VVVTDWVLEAHHPLVAPATDIQVFALKCYTETNTKYHVSATALLLHVDQSMENMPGSQQGNHLVSNSQLETGNTNSITM
jgi:hypothetical protein